MHSMENIFTGMFSPSLMKPGARIAHVNELCLYIYNINPYTCTTKTLGIKKRPFLQQRTPKLQPRGSKTPRYNHMHSYMQEAEPEFR